MFRNYPLIAKLVALGRRGRRVRMLADRREAVAERVKLIFSELCSKEGLPPNEAAARALKQAQNELELSEHTETVAGELKAVGIDLELARALVESSGGMLSQELAEQADELLFSSSVLSIGGTKPTLRAEARVGDVVALVCSSPSSPRLSAVHEGPDGRTHVAHAVVRLNTFGVHTLHVNAECGQAHTVLATTPTYELARAVEVLLDVLLWSWDDEWWDNALELELCTLLIAVEEDLSAFTQRFAHFMRVLDPEGSGQMDQLLDSARKELASALSERSGTAVGRLHSTLVQFMGMLALGMVPAAFADSLRAFDARKWLLATSKLRTSLAQLHASIPPYLLHISNGGSGGGAGSAPRLSQLHAHLASHLQHGTPLEPGLFWALLGNPLENADLASSGAVGTAGEGVRQLTCMPVISVADVYQPALLDRLVGSLNECLVRDVVMLGSFGLGHAITPGAEAESSKLLCALLRAGFGYVTNGNRMLPVLPMCRAALALQRAPPRAVLSRRKDVCRVLRNALGPRVLQLRVSTDFPTACARLRQHHPTSWVGPTLERLWAAMLHGATLTVFELWLIEPCGAACMVAADFGHAVGGSFYVATRWHDAAHSKLQLGFVLAFASAKALAQLGFSLWDLGGTDGSSMMKYKASVAEVLHRPAFAHAFQRARHAPLPAPIAAGIAVSRLQEADFFGAPAAPGV